MFSILLYLTIFVGFIYGIFKFLLYISNTFLLIDEYFVSKIKKIDDDIIVNYFGINTENIIDSNNNINTNKNIKVENNIKEQNDINAQVKDEEQKLKVINKNNNKKINKFLRLDFLISLFLGIIWFYFLY